MGPGTAVALAAGTFLAEHAAVYVAPRLLSRIAFLRAGPDRSVLVPRDAARALEQSTRRAWSYRTAPTIRYDAAHLPGPEVVDAGEAHMLFARDRCEVLARPRLRAEGGPSTATFGQSRPKALVRVRLIAERDRVVLRATYHPALTIGAAAAGLAACLGVGLGPQILLLPFLWTLVVTRASRHEAGRLLEAVEGEIANRVARLARGDHGAGAAQQQNPVDPSR